MSIFLTYSTVTSLVSAFFTQEERKPTYYPSVKMKQQVSQGVT